ncbi:MAG: YdcF family protein [Leptolyngbyaceae cyanobacterium SM2_5_2]|nr:YdcF family protein [Leptolyngbyaceae cyanobacterium SM2_5_2]
MAKLHLAEVSAPAPQAILVLGGGSGREEAAAQLAAQNPHLEIWVSSGDRLPDAAHAIFRQAGVDPERVHLDYQATDTVTNFTTLVPQFKQHRIQHLYVVTSDFHIPRAAVIGTLVLGHSHMTFTPVAVPSDYSPESWLKLVRDGGRSLLWIATGYTGEGLAHYLYPPLPQRALQDSQ